MRLRPASRIINNRGVCGPKGRQPGFCPARQAQACQTPRLFIILFAGRKALRLFILALEIKREAKTYN